MLYLSNYLYSHRLKPQIPRRNTMGDAELYSNYIRREPHDKSQKFVSNWHKKLLNHFLRESTNLTNNVLEIGPGHGYFASHVCRLGMNYEFIDTSPAVHDKMTSQGFIGHLGTVSDFQGSPKRFDLIWLSHVLEHSPTWVAKHSALSWKNPALNLPESLWNLNSGQARWRF